MDDVTKRIVERVGSKAAVYSCPGNRSGVIVGNVMQTIDRDTVTEEQAREWARLAGVDVSDIQSEE